jgi:hypothetical protein
MATVMLGRAHILSAWKGVANASGAVVRETGGRRLTFRYVPVRATVGLGEAEAARHLGTFGARADQPGIFLKDLKSEE